MDDTWWKSLEQLDKDQRHLIEGLDVDGNHLITGPPGSGKTNLLLLRAKYLYLQGRKNVAVITYNRALTEFIASGVRRYSFPDDRISTYLKWGLACLAQHGKRIDIDNMSFEEQTAAVSLALEELVESEPFLTRYDYIFLDEAQDYTANEIELFDRLSHKIFAVGDSRQQIYKKKDGMRRLREICTEASPLKYHYRNGRKICRVADALVGKLDDPEGMESTSLYNEKAHQSSVEIICSPSVAHQAETIVNSLRTQLLAYPDEFFGVACPRHRELDEVWAVIEASEIGDHAQLQKVGEYRPFAPGRNICVTTVHGTKGMEFRALHIAGAEYISRFGDRQKALIYTGMTRAKTSLSLHHSATLPGYLEAAVESVRGPRPTPSLSELFGEGS